VQQAESKSAAIAWGDESGLRSDAQVGRGDAPKRKTPATNHRQKKRHRINFIASVSNQGLVRFMLYAGKLDSLVFITFLERLIERRERKLYWIVDCHPIHQAVSVQDWLCKHPHEIELVFVLSYSPQLNPVEYLNGDVKPGVHSKYPKRFIDGLSQLTKWMKGNEFVESLDHPEEKEDERSLGEKTPDSRISTLQPSYTEIALEVLIEDRYGIYHRRIGPG
jgi:hypothetical protein